MKRTTLVIFFILIVAQFDFTYTYWSKGDYAVWNNSSPDGLTLYNINGNGGNGRVSDILEIGSNEKFILVKSHNYYDELKFEYWILDISKDTYHLNSDEIMLGPFTLEIFKLRRKNLELKH